MFRGSFLQPKMDACPAAMLLLSLSAGVLCRASGIVIQGDPGVLVIAIEFFGTSFRETLAQGISVKQVLSNVCMIIVHDNFVHSYSSYAIAECCRMMCECYNDDTIQ